MTRWPPHHTIAIGTHRRPWPCLAIDFEVYMLNTYTWTAATFNVDATCVFIWWMDPLLRTLKLFSRRLIRNIGLLFFPEWKVPVRESLCICWCCLDKQWGRPCMLMAEIIYLTIFWHNLTDVMHFNVKRSELATRHICYSGWFGGWVRLSLVYDF